MKNDLVRLEADPSVAVKIYFEPEVKLLDAYSFMPYAMYDETVKTAGYLWDKY